MAQRHSWHKHLPVRPLVAFRFLVAPRAPLTSEPGSRLLDKRYATVDTAAAHEQTYGHWMCEAPYQGGGGLVASIRDQVARPGERVVLGEGGERAVVPAEVLAAGVAWVNAFIDPRAARLQRVWFGGRTDPYGVNDYLGELGRTTEHPKDVLTADHVTTERERMLDEMRAAMDRVAALVWGA